MRSHILYGTSIGALIFGMGTAFAVENETFTIDEITVTAQKRAQSSQDVAISISAFGGEDIREMRVGEIADIAYQVPQVQVQTGFNQPYFAIRGIGINEFSGNTDSPVAMHFDEVYLSRATQSSVALFDVERIEVLKGPQGTLFGRNTTGGSVNIISRKPTDVLESEISLTIGKWGLFEADGFISGPLTDTVKARFSFTTRQATKGMAVNNFDGSTMGEPDTYAARLQFQWDASEDTTVNFTVFGSADKSTLLPYGNRGTSTVAGINEVLNNGANPADFLCDAYVNGTVTSTTPDCVNFTGYQEGDTDPLTTNQTTPNKVDNEGYGGILRIEHDLEFASLTFLGSYMGFERVHFENAIAAPTRVFSINWYNKINEYTAELRLASSGEEALNYVVGLYYQRDELDVANTAYIDENPQFGIFTSTEYLQNTNAYAAFAHVEYDITEAFSVVAGLRYSEENKDFVGATPFHVAGSAEPFGKKATIPNPLGLLAQADLERSDSNLSWKVGANFRPMEDVLIYTHVERGFKSGGFNGGLAFSNEEFSEFKAEEITAYEVGLKSTLVDGRLQFNAAGFHYKYKNPQVNADREGAVAPVSTNADTSTYWGLEADIVWRPSEPLTLKAGIGWLDARLGTFSIRGGEISGRDPINAPKWTLNALARYETEVSDGLLGIMVIDANYRSAKFLESTNSINSRQAGFALVNGRMAIAADDRNWELALWVKNLTNKSYLTYVNDLPEFGVILDIFGEPRSYGLTFTKNF